MREISKIILCSFVLFYCANTIKAQISAKDSIALKKILEEDKPLILNEEAIKAIKFDNIKPDTPKELLFSPDFPIAFDSDLPQVSVEKDSILYLPLKPYRISSVNEIYTQHLDSIKIHMNLDIEPGGPVIAPVSGVGVVGIFDADKLLRRIFWKSERAKNRNKKRAHVLKYY